MDILMKLALGIKLTEDDIRSEISNLRDTDLVLLVVRGQKITDKDLANEFYEVCESVHASCDSECPVYRLNGNKVPDTANDFKANRGCDCFKNGTAMLKFTRKKLKAQLKK